MSNPYLQHRGTICATSKQSISPRFSKTNNRGHTPFRNRHLGTTTKHLMKAVTGRARRCSNSPSCDSPKNFAPSHANSPADQRKDRGIDTLETRTSHPAPLVSSSPYVLIALARMFISPSQRNHLSMTPTSETASGIKSANSAKCISQLSSIVYTKRPSCIEFFPEDREQAQCGDLGSI